MKFTQEAAALAFAPRYGPLIERKESLRHRLSLFYERAVQAPIPMVGALAFPAQYPKEHRFNLSQMRTLTSKTFPPTELTRFSVATSFTLACRTSDFKPQLPIACSAAWFGSRVPEPCPTFGATIDKAAISALKNGTGLGRVIKNFAGKQEPSREEKIHHARRIETRDLIQAGRIEFLEDGDQDLSAALTAISKLLPRSGYYWNTPPQEWVAAVSSIRKRLSDKTKQLETIDLPELDTKSDAPGLPIHFFANHGRWPNHMDPKLNITDKHISSQYAMECWLNHFPTKVEEQ